MSNVLWSSFLARLAENKNSPVLCSVLAGATFLKLEENNLYIGCANVGMKDFLETRKVEIKSYIYEFFGLSVSVVCEVLPKDKKDKKNKTQNSLEENKKPINYVKNNAFLRFKRSFDSFAVSSSNQLAYTAALSVVQNPGSTYNPLFIYGGVGVGKTHLAQAIVSKLVQENPNFPVLFCSSEEFTNDLIDSIRSKNTPLFKKKYRRIKALVVDDIQFIAGKEAVQEEFFHTFNSIVDAGGQIVLTSDRSPREMKRLEDRLRSRFSGGLLVDIQPPDFELRTAILLIKAKERNIDLDISTARILAEQITDVRELEGRLLEYYSRALRTGSPITASIIKKHSEEQKQAKRNVIKTQDVLRIVSVYFEISVAALKSNTRKERFSYPRQVAMYLLRSIKKLTYDEIAYLLKRKDHTTVIHGVSKIESLLIKNPQVKEEVDRITSSLYASS